MRKSFRAIQLFAGTGSMTRAFQEQGVEIIWSWEPRKELAQVHRANFPGLLLEEMPVGEMREVQFPEYELLLAQIDVFSSAASESRARLEIENTPVKELLYIIEQTCPKAFCFSVFHANLFRNMWKEQLIESLSREGYTVMFQELSAAEFGGVPFAGKNGYFIGIRSALRTEAFRFPEPVGCRPTGGWYLREGADQEALFLGIPEEIRDLIQKENPKPGTIYCRQRRDWKAESEKSAPYRVVKCENCARLGRRSWYDTFIAAERGIRRLEWKEYLALQGDEETIFPAEMSLSKIWECMPHHGIYCVERRIASQLIKALSDETEPEAYEDVEKKEPEYIASRFLKEIPDFTKIWTKKGLGMLRMPSGAGSIRCTWRVAQGMLERTYARWKIVLLYPRLEAEHQLLHEKGQYEQAVRIQSLEELKRYMTEGGGGICLVTCAKWQQYLKWEEERRQRGGQNHNGICLICYEAEKCLAALRDTPKYLPQAYYIGISCRTGRDSAKELRDWFGEVKYEYRWSEAVQDRLLVPVYGEVWQQGQLREMPEGAGTRQAFAAEVFADQLLSERREKALVVLESLAEAAEFCGDLFHLKNACLENPGAAARALKVQSAVLQKRLVESDYFLLTAGYGDRDQTVQKFGLRRRGILVTVNMWQGPNVPEISTVYIRGPKSEAELFELANKAALPWEGKDRARMVFCGCDQTELVEGTVHSALPEMQDLVQALWEGDYRSGHRSLDQLKKRAGIWGRMVERELGFLYPTGYRRELSQTEKEEVQKLCTVWCCTSKHAGCCGSRLLKESCPSTAANEDTPAEMEAPKSKEAQELPPQEFASSYEQGVRLEEMVMALLRRLFFLDERSVGELEEQVKLVLDTLRRQRSGAQGGHDIRVVYQDLTGKKRICLFECKNKRTTEITVADIAGKLEQAKMVETEVEHWILIAPKAKLANDVAPYLERMERHPGSQLPIRSVQVWTEENGVRELFGLVPDLYHEIYGQGTEYEDAPEGWTGARYRQVLERWKKKLCPVALLPVSFLDYPERTEKLLFDVCNDRELRQQYENLYRRYIRLHYLDDEGRYVQRRLEDDLEKWLFQTGHRIKILLGEFGDGKTFFMYSFCRRLLEKFRENPEANYLPVCFSLKRMEESKTPSVFIEERMRELGASMADFLELKQNYHVLVCLDGLDEMSTALDRLSLLKNAKRLIGCCEELRDVKIVITSRKQCFLSYEIQDMLRERLGGFGIWQLAHVTECDVKKHLTSILEQKGEREASALEVPPKWMALARKPLFFEMLQSLLEDGVSVGGSENAIYDAYIRKCLWRKFDESFERSDMWVRRAETIERIYRMLEEIAVKMQKKGEERLKPEELSSFLDVSAAEILWKDHAANEKTAEDAQNRFSMRLLFKYEGSGEIAFFHRSVREYFVGKHLLNLLKENPRELLLFLEQYTCNYEVLGFMAEGMKADAEEMLLKRLVSFLPECREKRSIAAASILQICFLVNARIPEGEWHGQKLDGVYIPGADFSGQNLSHSYIRNANLNNVRLDDADCSYCDFTGSRLEETKGVEALRQCGQNLRAIYADGLVRDWEIELADSQVFWTGKSCFDKARLFEKGWLVWKEQEERELFWEKGQIASALHYWGREDAEILDMAGAAVLLRLPLGREEYFTAAVDCVKREVLAHAQTRKKTMGKICGETTVVISDGEQVCIFSRERKQSHCFLVQADGQKELVAEMEAETCRVGILTEEKLLLMSCRIDRTDFRKKEHMLRAEGIGHAAMTYGGGIALGSSAGSIYWVPVNWETLELTWEKRRKLQLGIYCRNVRTEGLVPEELKKRLERHGVTDPLQLTPPSAIPTLHSKKIVNN